MKVNKKIIMFGLSLVSAASLSTVVISSFERNGSSFSLGHADEQTYNLVLDKFNSSLSSDSMKTTLGNDITFSYFGYSSGTTNWGTIANSGYLKNVTQISGLKSINVDFVTADKNLTVLYGWFYDDYIVAASGTINSSSPSFNFNGEIPSFFKIINNSDSNIEIASITVSYSCSETSLPEVYSGLQFTLINNDTAYSVKGDISYRSTLKHVVIPSEHAGKPVKEIDSYAFSSFSALESIIIQNSTVTIGGSAFQNCTSLASAYIPASVFTINDNIFEGCSGLTSIVVDENSTRFCSYENALFNKAKTEIFSYALGCGETSYVMPNTVRNMQGYIFKGCNLLSSVTLSSSLTSIREYTFENCTSLESITIPSTVTSIGFAAFRNCTSLESIALSSASIQTDAFRGCSSLSSITLNEGVQTIGDTAFFNCTSLESITIPNSVTSVGKNVFGDCYSLASIDVSNESEYLCSVDGALFNKAKTEFIAYPKARVGSLSIPSGVTAIPNEAFAGCGANLTALTIPNTVETIGEASLNGCSSLTNLVIPDSVTSIGVDAFAGCDSLETITLSENIAEISYRTFANCTSLESIVIPNSVTTIGRWAFVNCQSLETIVFGSDLKTIGMCAFYQCSSAKSITLPEGLETINASAFEGSHLSSLTISSTVTYIGDSCFDFEGTNEVTFSGTVDQWNAMTRGAWDINNTITVVHCNNGDVAD